MIKHCLIALLISMFWSYCTDAMANASRHKGHHATGSSHLMAHSTSSHRASKTHHHASAAQAPTADRQAFIVAIDAGHGGKDTGAIGPSGTYEKQVAYAISRKLARLIDQDPTMTPVVVRKGDTFIGLKRRAEIARDARADLFVSLHADAYRDADAKGSSVFTLLNRGKVPGVPPASTRKASNNAAGKILTALRSQQHLHCRQVKKAGYAVLRSPDVPSMLIETGFISNPQDEQKLANPAHQESLARSIYHGIQAYAQSARHRGKTSARHVTLASRH